MREQKSPHVSVLDNGNRWQCHVLGVWPSALGPFPCIGEGDLVASGTQAGGTQAHGDACLVHHLEHIHQPPAFLTDKIALALTLLTEVQGRVGRAAVTHFVIESGKGDAVARADGAIGLQSVFGDDKQGDSFYPRCATGHLGKHQVHDIL